MELDVVDSNNQKISNVNVNEAVFGLEIKNYLLHQVVRMQLANKRSGTASTKGRSEVSGGGKKPWKQKGTGRARAGSSRSPIWRGGGTTFGPKPRDYSYKVPKKVCKAALKSAFTLKVKSNEIIIMDKIELKSSKTKEMVLLLNNFNINETVLFLVEKENKNLQLAARNLPNVRVLNLAGLNVYDLIRSTKLIIAQDIISKIEERLQ